MSRRNEDLLNRNFKDASSLLENKKYKKAFEKLDKAEKLAEKSESPGFLCQVLLRKGEALFFMDKPEEGQAFYDKALEVFRTSDLDEKESSDLQFTLLNTLDELALHFKNAGSVENAENCYMNKIQVYEFLLEKYPEDEEPEMDIARTFDSIARLYEYFEPEDLEPEAAKQYYEKILDLKEKAFELLPDSETYIYGLAGILGKLVDLHIMQQDYEGAIEYQERAVEVLEELIDLLANWRDLEAKGNAYDKLGFLYAETGNMELAEEQYSEALEYYEMIFDDEWPLSVKITMAAMAMERGKTLLLSKQFDSAEKSMALALDFLEEVDKEELEEALEAGEERFIDVALKVIKQLELSKTIEGGLEEEEGSGYLEKMLEISSEYAKALSDLGRPDEAKEFAARSEEIFGKIRETD